MLIFIFLLIIIIIIICHNYIKSGSAQEVYYSLEIYGKNYPFKSDPEFPATYEGKRYIIYVFSHNFNDNEYYKLVEKYIDSHDMFSPHASAFIYKFFNCSSVLDTHLNIGFRYTTAIENGLHYIGFDNYFNLYNPQICLNKSVLDMNKDDIKHKIDLIFCCPPYKTDINEILKIINKTSVCMTKYFILCFKAENKLLTCLSSYYNYIGCLPYKIKKYIYPLWIFKNVKTIEKATKNDEEYILASAKNKININNVDKFAVVSLLMINDSYLVGLIMLAKSILRFGKPHNVDLICMCTPDISKEAISILSKYYIIKFVDYISLPEKKIKLQDPVIRKIYSKTFTKIQCMKFTEYKKIVLIDADMIVISNKFFNIFNYTAPAGVYHGYTTEFIRKIILEKYDMPKIGELYPEYLFRDSFGKDLFIDYKGKKTLIHFLKSIETSICLLQPSIEDFNNMLKLLKTAKPYTLSSDTTLLNIYFKKWYHLDFNYLGRWANSEQNKKIIVLDLFGPKPWNIETFNNNKNYTENTIWLKLFKDFYDTDFYNFHNKSLDILYKKIIEEDISDSPIIKYANYYVYYNEEKKEYLGCAHIRTLEKIYIDKLTGDFMPVLKYLLFWNSSPSGIYIKSPCSLDPNLNLNLDLNLDLGLKFIKNKKNYFIYQNSI